MWKQHIGENRRERERSELIVGDSKSSIVILFRSKVSFASSILFPSKILIGKDLCAVLSENLILRVMDINPYTSQGLSILCALTFKIPDNWRHEIKEAQGSLTRYVQYGPLWIHKRFA
ncbi:hypothetical protein Pst134EB_026207 [Puccinia striiformis f. sp. tritici]|nr:hypothetical protein Pst134EB_026207 [Puccinia striiformis f. sp. tritici]